MWIRHLSISSLFLCIFIVEVRRSQKVLSFCTTSFTREQVPGRCRPLVKCIRHFEDIPKLVHRPCTLKSGAYGVCCPNFTRLKPKKSKSISWWDKEISAIRLITYIYVNCKKIIIHKYNAMEECTNVHFLHLYIVVYNLKFMLRG